MKVYVLAVIEPGTRRIRVLGATRHPVQSWVVRQARNVLMDLEDEGFYNTHRPHRTLNQAAPLRPLPDDVTDLDRFRVRRRDRAGGVIHEYHLVA
jgi:putative transposase